jgi:outer membrane biosynthesis protein TonB
MDWLESWLNSLEIKFRGGMTEAPEDFQKRLVNFPKPSYSALAQRAGLQGFVKLQVRVKQWRAKPASINGQPVEVISTVTFNFQLH